MRFSEVYAVYAVYAVYGGLCGLVSPDLSYFFISGKWKDFMLYTGGITLQTVNGKFVSVWS